jgi:hypothetical protein
MPKKEIEIIDRGGAKTVAKKTSVITWAKRIFFTFTIIWFAFGAVAPLYVKNHYGEQIKRSIVVSMFFDLQRNINEQYEKLLKAAAKNINLEKPVAIAIDKMKIADKGVAKVTDTTATAKSVTTKTNKLTGALKTAGLNTGAADKAIGTATGAVQKVDDQAAIINQQLDKMKGELTRVAQTEIDKAIDEQLKGLLDKHTGLGTTLLTNYGIKHVMPWRPSTWPITNKIYADLEKSNVAVITSLTGMVNRYFGFVAWGLVFAAWAAALFIWFMVFKKYKHTIAAFLVCPRCGHAYADRRTAMGFLKLFQPWNWFM